jgi:hypothetical protein
MKVMGEGRWATDPLFLSPPLEGGDEGEGDTGHERWAIIGWWEWGFVIPDLTRNPETG